ncbi:MAG: hypothetical protein QME51_06230, partial [Planctomycetota bacterium]|nr:hypothetical protein [Planctomycetota bacterium]
LKMFQDKRIVDAERKALIENTKNLDSQWLEKLGEKGKVGQKATLEINDIRYKYHRSLSPMKNLEQLDGFGKYTGKNVRLGQQLSNAEQEAIELTEATLLSYRQEIKNLGIRDLNEITPERQAAMAVNAWKEEGATDAMNMIMNKFGWKEIPVLSETEQKILDILKNNVGKQTDAIASYYEATTNQIFPRVKNYHFSLFYEDEVLTLPSDVLMMPKYRTEQGFLTKRVGTTKRIPRHDIFNMFDETIDAQSWYLNVQPVIDDVKVLVKHPDYIKASGQMGGAIWDETLTLMAHRGWNGKSTYSAFYRGLKNRLTTSTLGLKASSILMQPFTIFDGIAYATSNWGLLATKDIMAEFGKSWLLPGKTKEIVSRGIALQQRVGAGELALQEILKGDKTGIWEGFKRLSMKGITWADLKTTAGIQEGVEKILIKKGIPNAHKEAEMFMQLINGSSTIMHRPLILADGDFSRLFWMYQSFFLNRWGMIANDFINGGLHYGDYKTKMKALAALGIMTGGYIAERMTRKEIYETISGKEIRKPESLTTQMMLALPSNVPFFGQLAEAAFLGGSSDIPVQRFFNGLFTNTKTLLAGRKEEAGVKAGINLGESVIGALTGFPTVQAGELAERFLVPKEPKSRRQSDAIRFYKKEMGIPDDKKEAKQYFKDTFGIR